MCRLLNSKQVRTRKAHACGGCERVQPVGTLMLAEKTVGDGRMYTLYLCEECIVKRARCPYQSFERGELASW